MLTPVERVLILQSADLLHDVGPRQLLRLAEVAREVDIAAGETIYDAPDMADAIYMVVRGRVRLLSDDSVLSQVGPGEAFGTWALVDDAERGHRAECVEDGLVLALRRDDFYDVAAGDLTLLQQVVRVLAKRLRALVAERSPGEARVEGEGIEKPETLDEPPAPIEAVPEGAAGAALAAAIDETQAAPEVAPPTMAPSADTSPKQGPATQPSVGPSEPSGGPRR